VFQKILIANRGEIACRIIRTARRMGIRTVAVYSQADRDAPHVQMADEAIAVGPPPAAQSYLDVDRILRACVESGAEAVHPGYGFLSENAAFSQRLSDAGVAFIGPSPDAMRRLGDKIAAKQLAREAGVSTVPGHAGELRSADQAVDAARGLGYPVMLKASAGGGGKGMRIVRDDAECRLAFDSASREATASFGDGRLLLEKYIDHPRHIEIQVLGDQHGRVVSLGERECSLQRRHQKVIEEAPSMFVDAEMRREMGRQAVALAEAVNYASAGTVEFIVDAARNFYFLEMNTRLQVEHPVTELVTGLDLVELMVRIAAGEPLPFPDGDVPLAGWAIEARVYAEDPMRGFLPSIGRLVRCTPPSRIDGVRIDMGVEEGGEVSMFYDPMIAKVIGFGATREAARLRLMNALNEFCIRGVAHNISFLGALLAHPRFVEGRLSTNLIAEEYPDGFRPQDAVHDDPALLVMVAAVIHRRYRDRAAQISGQMPGYEPRVECEWVVTMDGRHHAVSVEPAGDGYAVVHDGRLALVHTNWQFGQPLFRGDMDGAPVCVQVERRNLVYRLIHWGYEVDVTVLSARAAELLARMPIKHPPDRSKFVLSPMPGLLVRLAVNVGDDVKVGQEVAIVEAMKMENLLRSEKDGRVKQVFADVGETLSVDQPILEFESQSPGT
jgi:propionyl-CoA carboxylase alpha chain